MPSARRLCRAGERRVGDMFSLKEEEEVRLIVLVDGVVGVYGCVPVFALEFGFF